MTLDIEAKEVTVGKLFSPDFVFRIPIYQRPLSWEKDHFEQLFDDIFDSHSNNERQYFLGSIILQADERDKYKFDLVDGQQRMSALAILMAVIRDSTTNENLREKLASYLYQHEDKFKRIPAELRILPWEELKEQFVKFVYTIGGTNKYVDEFKKGHIKYADTQDPQYHLYEAITTFQSRISENLKEAGPLESYIIYLLNSVYLVYIKATSFASAYRLFNVLNARGLPLNTSDLLKSENLGEIKDDQTRVAYANIWRKIENRLGREELENVIAFIRTIKLKEKAKLGIYDEYRKFIFTKGVLKRGKDYFEYLREIADIYSDKILDAEIVAHESKKNEYKNIVNLLQKYIPFIDWVPPLIAFYHKFKSDELLLPFVSKLEKKVIIEWIVGFSATERITSLNKIIRFIESESDPQTVIDSLLFFKSEETVPGRVSRGINYSEKRLIEAILNIQLNDDQFYSIYGGKLARYILLRIDMNRWELENFPGYPGTVTVEHILPQGPPEKSEWMTMFTEEQRKKWTNKLGNLVLLSGIKNSKAQNYDFKRKKEIYFKGKSTAFKITKDLEAIEKWTPEEVEKRHEALLSEAKKIFLSY
jgi:uncharacterized protein with ParB-like and HNH nuclease domain